MHDLVAAGIGGRTVAEARERLSWEELQSWMLYVKENGPLSVGQRLDYGLARIMLMLSGLAGSKTPKQLKDFLPAYYTRAEEEEELTLEALENLF